MKARILRPEEWGRLERTGVPTFATMPPEDVAVVAVESGADVVACLTVVRLTHFEGLWIDPEFRNAGVARSLVGEAIAAARRWTDRAVIGGAREGAEGDQMRGILTRLGADRMPLEFYMLPLGGDECRPQ